MKAPDVAYIIAAEYGLPRATVDYLWSTRPGGLSEWNFSPLIWRLALEGTPPEQLRDLPHEAARHGYT